MAAVDGALSSQARELARLLAVRDGQQRSPKNAQPALFHAPMRYRVYCRDLEGVPDAQVTVALMLHGRDPQLSLEQLLTASRDVLDAPGSR